MKTILYSLCVIFRPVDTFYYIKHNRDRITILPALLLIFMTLPIRVAGIFTEHFPLAYSLPEDTTIIFEAFIMLAPLLTWSVACFITTAVLEGETTYKENLTAIAYCMVPYILLTVPFALVSNVMSLDEQIIYSMMTLLKWAWVISLVLVYIKTMNSYTFGKAVFIAIISAIAVVLIWGVVFLIFMLTNQLLDFINTVILEVRMRFT